ncbi:MAG: hypothetical protein M3432_02870, partial [Chloroflexota bacterium]|nr:hypothetical protein [Chloroflexota bacterium]
MRDPKVPVRRQAVQRRETRRASGGGPRGSGASQILVAALFGLLLLGTGAFVFGALNAQPTRSTAPSGVAGLPSGGASTAA